MHWLAYHTNCYFLQTMTKYSTVRGFSDAQSIKSLNYCTEWKSCSEECTWFWKLSWKKLQKRYRDKANCFTWESFINQCLVRWPGWMMSQEAIRYIRSFIFDLFLLSGLWINGYSRCGNTFEQGSMATKILRAINKNIASLCI